MSALWLYIDLVESFIDVVTVVSVLLMVQRSSTAKKSLLCFGNLVNILFVPTVQYRMFFMPRHINSCSFFNCLEKYHVWFCFFQFHESIKPSCNVYIFNYWRTIRLHQCVKMIGQSQRTSRLNIAQSCTDLWSCSPIPDSKKC